MHEIVANPNLQINDLMDRLQLSRKQIDYRLDKINDWLKENQLPLLAYNRSSGFQTSPLLLKALTKLTEASHNVYYWSDEERVNLILLFLLSTVDFVSLVHLTSALGVSRNTVLRDLKKAKQKAAAFSCSLNYSRRTGYSLNGDEWDLRLLLRTVISDVLNAEQGKLLLEYPLSSFQRKQVEQVKVELENIEERLQIRYIDERLIALPYELVYLSIRIHQGNRLETIDQTLVTIIAESEEYRALTDLFHLFAFMQPQFAKERAYLAAQLLISNLSVGERIFNRLDQKIFNVAQEVVAQFESIACVKLHEREELTKQLFQHLKPAYYRSKFGLKLINPLYETISKEHPELHHLVKKAMQPFVTWLGSPLSEDEYAYITMHFGGWLEREGRDLSARLKAVVVCPKGVAISKLLIHRLKEMFPEILFLDALSVREFYQFPVSYDLVFSTVFVQTKARLYLVKPEFDLVERNRLIREVRKSLYGFSVPDFDVNELIDVIRPHVTILDQAALTKALRRFFSKQKFEIREQKELDKPVLSDLITKETIQIIESVSDWEEAIRVAAAPLVNNQSIQPRYIEAMIENIKKEGPYVVITPRVAIPHARPEDGVNVLSMSLLVVKESVDFAPEKPVNLIIVLAAIDNETHLKALAQLMEMLSSPKTIDRLLQLENKDEMMKMINHYAKEMD